MISPSLARRNAAQHTLRGVQPRGWLDGFSLRPLAVLNTGADATSASAHTPGSWVQLFAAAATNSTDTVAALWLQFGMTNSGAAADNSFLADIATGASGAESPIVSDVALGGITSSGGRQIVLPVRVAGNTRIAYRVRPATANRNVRLANTAVTSAALMTAPFAGRLPTTLDTLGTSTATSSGTACSGSSGTYTQITAATARDYQALILVPSGPGNGTAVTAGQARLDLAIGASGSEVVVASARVILQVTNGLHLPLAASSVAMFAAHVPAGARLAISHSLAATPEVLCGCVIGVPYV